MHQNRAATILLVSPEVVENAQDNAQLEQRLRELPGRQNLRILNVRKLTDGSGKIKGYEVDIR
jgi:hypothetical protein